MKHLLFISVIMLCSCMTTPKKSLNNDFSHFKKIGERSLASSSNYKGLYLKSQMNHNKNLDLVISAASSLISTTSCKEISKEVTSCIDEAKIQNKDDKYIQSTLNGCLNASTGKSIGTIYAVAKLTNFLYKNEKDKLKSFKKHENLLYRIADCSKRLTTRFQKQYSAHVIVR